MQDKNRTDNEGWGIPPGLKEANGTELEVRFPDPTEPKKPQQSGGGAGGGGMKAGERCSGRFLTLGLARGGLHGAAAVAVTGRCLRKLHLISDC